MTAVAVIVHAENRPDHLDLCLATLYGQTFEDFEILVADTGENSVNDEVVEHHQAHLEQRLRHIHAPGSPQNLARALNASVLSTSAEYLVFLGGRCLAQPEFVEGHIAVADYGYFAHGETLPLDEAITEAIDASTLGSGQAYDEDWLRLISPSWHAEHLMSTPVNRFRHWLKKDTPGLQYWNCETSSVFRDDLLKVNGFDMDVDDWRQDRDLANRLQNNGLEPVEVGPDGNVLRLLDPAHPGRQDQGGRVPATLEPGGETRAIVGLNELMAGASAA